METTKGTIIIGVLKTSGKFLTKIFSLFFFLLVSFQTKAQLVINEVSQGASGSKEYVEFLVIGTPTCTTIPCLDLRGYIIDDNNGTFATGAGTGIANGCIKLSNDPLWSCVPAGTIILIYNDADLNPLVPAQDLSLTDGNCKLVIPISNCILFDKNTVQPTVGTSAYPAGGFIVCGNWSEISMANSDDSFQTRDAAGTLIHAVSWGNNTLANIIYFATSAAGAVSLNTNSVDNNPSNQANWIKVGVAGNETPGAPNNAANAAWINSMSNNCNTILPLTLSFSTLPTACACTGSATVTASGAVGPYTYTWTPSAITTNTLGGLCVGNYSLSVSSSNGCLVTDTVSIISSVILSTVITTTNITCNGFANGISNVSVGGSPGPFTYTWTPLGGNAATATNLPPGNYTVTITDAGGCTGTATTTVSNPPVLTATVTETDITCFGANNGTATVTASGGTGAYTYSWTPSGGISSTATNLSQGNYSCTVTDANGCTITSSALVSEPSILSLTVTSTSVTCNGLSNGTTSVTASGGIGVYTYTWSPIGGNTTTASGLPFGNYTVTVNDVNGCIATASVLVNQNPVLTANIAAIDAPCFGGNGTATVTANGGTPGYTYSWSPIGGTGSTTSLPQGNYTVTVTDVNSCTVTATTTINQPAALTATVNTTAITCFGANNGTATVTVNGGVTAYTYSWSPSGGTNSTAANLSQGNYTVLVTDAKGCTISASGLVTEPAVISLIVTSTSVSCNGGSNGTTSVSATGGTGVYTYTWSPTGGNSAIANGLPFGNYSVTVNDANGCTATASTTVSQPTAITVTLTSTNASCSTNNGTATANASGGTGALTYTWMPSGGNTNTASGLGAGTYTVKVTDANGCSVTSSTTIIQPPSFTLTVSSTSVTCNGGNDGSATANIIGGTPLFNYTWSPIGGTNASTGNILSAGTYTVNVTDAGGCSSTSTVTLSQPSPVTVSGSGQTVCNGQSATLTGVGAGGNAPYTYSWNTGATGSPITVNTIVNTTYTVVATDNKGCVSLPDTAMVNVLAPLNIIVVSNDTTCAGQPAILTATAGGGNGSYTITWMPSGAVGNSINVNPTTTTIYTATVTDGCTATPASATGQVTVLQNPLISFNPNPASGCAPVCVTFAAVSSNVPGNNIVTYTWNFGDGGTANGLNAAHCYANSGSFSVYLLGITQMGCRDSILKNSLITVFPQPVADFGATTFETDIYSPTINFYDLSLSNITNWQWNFQTGANSTVQNPIYTYGADGTYPVTLIVTNANGCKDTIIKIITIKPVFTFYAPNAITPNYDGTNDVFLPEGTAWDLSTYNLWVFDRWGNQLFHGKDAYKGWDGTRHGEVLQEDVYVWKVELNDSFGAPHEFNGVVSIVR